MKKAEMRPKMRKLVQLRMEKRNTKRKIMMSVRDRMIWSHLGLGAWLNWLG